MPRFSTNVLTVEEHILLERIKLGSFESLVQFMEKRICDPSVNLRIISFPDLLPLWEECAADALSNPINVRQPNKENDNDYNDFFTKNSLLDG